MQSACATFAKGKASGQESKKAIRQVCSQPASQPANQPASKAESGRRGWGRRRGCIGCEDRRFLLRVRNALVIFPFAGHRSKDSLLLRPPMPAVAGWGFWLLLRHPCRPRLLLVPQAPNTSRSCQQLLEGYDGQTSLQVGLGMPRSDEALGGQRRGVEAHCKSA